MTISIFQHPVAATVSRDDPTDRVIVKFRDLAISQAATLTGDHLGKLSAWTGVSLTHLRPLSGGSQLLKLPYSMTLAEVEVIAAIAEKPAKPAAKKKVKKKR